MEFNPQIQLAGLLEWMAEQMNACHGMLCGILLNISEGRRSAVCMVALPPKTIR